MRILTIILCLLSVNAFAEVTPERFQDTKERAEKGDVFAYFDLAIFYEKGLGVRRNPVEAVKWWQKLAARGDDAALWSLGSFYESGEGVIRDYTEAYALYSVAAVTQRCARDSLNQLEGKLSVAQIEAGQKRAKEIQAEIKSRKATIEKKWWEFWRL